MQLFSKDSSNFLLRAEIPLNDDTEEKTYTVPLMSNVANTAIKPQTINFNMNPQWNETVENASISTGDSVLMSALLENKKEKLNLEQKSQEEKLIFVLENMFEVENLFYDHKTLLSLTINDYPKKYFYLKLMTSALYAHAALYSVKNRVLDLINSIPKNKKHRISQGKIALGRAMTHLINNKLIHQKCLNRILLNNFDEIPEGMDIEEMQKSNAGIRAEIRKVKHRLCEYRRAYSESLKASDLSEKTILENVSHYLSEDYLAFTIRKIFPSLSIPNIKKLINTHTPMSATTSTVESAISAASAASSVSAASAASSVSAVSAASAASAASATSATSATSAVSAVDVMEKKEFKLIRSSVPRAFWELLDTKLNKAEFNEKLFLFLLTSWQIDDSTKLKLNRDLMLAQNENELIAEYKILSNKLFHQKLNLNGFKIVNCICQLASSYQRLTAYNRFGNKDKFKLKKEMFSLTDDLNNAYLSIYENDYLPYLNAKEINSTNVAEYNLKLKIDNINDEMDKLAEYRRKIRIKRYAKRYTKFVYHVLLHFKENASIDYSCLESIARRIILSPPEIEDQSPALNSEFPSTEIEQTVIEKWEKKLKSKKIQEDGALASISTIAARYLETAPTHLPQGKRFKSSSIDPDNESSFTFQEIKSTTLESSLSASLGEIASFPIDAMIAELADSPVPVDDFITSFAEEPLDTALQQNQVVDSFENSFLTAKRKAQQIEQTHDSFALALQKVEEDVKNIVSTDVKSQHQLVNAEEYWQILGSLISDESSSGSTNMAINQLVEAKRMQVARQHSQEIPNLSQSESIVTSSGFEQSKLRFAIQNFNEPREQSTSSSCVVNFKPSQQITEQAVPPRPALMIEDNQLTELFPNLSSLISLHDLQAE